MDVIKTLPRQEQIKLLNQKNTSGESPINIAARTHPEYLTSFLAITNKTAPQNTIKPQENTFKSRFIEFKNRFSASKPAEVTLEKSNDTSETTSPRLEK